jgi:ParB-like chromosome segregation protein Spo0J
MEWTLEKRKISELTEYAKNPRSLSKEQGDHLKVSISKFGQCEPIVINTDNVIIGGHQRVRILRTIGKKEVDVYVPSRTLSEKEVEELNIRLNKNVGEWDFDMLANAWEPTDLVEWGFTETDLFDDVVEAPSKKSDPKYIIQIETKSLDKFEELENAVLLLISEAEGVEYKIKRPK